MMAAPKLYDVNEAADYLRVKRSTLFGLIRTGELGSVKVGRRRLFTDRHLAEYLDRRDRPATAAS